MNDDVRQEELIDEFENRRTLEVIREESKCSAGPKENALVTDCYENSQRALHR